MKKYPSLKPIVIRVPSNDAAALQRVAAKLEADLRENFQRLDPLLRLDSVNVSQDSSTRMLIFS